MNPPLHNKIFGGEAEGKEWAGRFIFLPSSYWAFTYLQYYDTKNLDDSTNDIIVPELTGHGSTPREAFEACVSSFIYYNNQEESPTLKEILPILRNYFNEDGGVKLEHFIV